VVVIRVGVTWRRTDVHIGKRVAGRGSEGGGRSVRVGVGCVEGLGREGCRHGWDGVGGLGFWLIVRVGHGEGVLPDIGVDDVYAWGDCGRREGARASGGGLPRRGEGVAGGEEVDGGVEGLWLVFASGALAEGRTIVRWPADHLSETCVFAFKLEYALLEGLFAK